MIEVLKQAYQLLLTEPHAPTVCNQLEVILRQAIAELESQEPVAWDLADKVRQDLDRQSCPDAFMRIAVESIVKHHPPQRTWVGLTDEEAQWLYDNCRTPSNLIDMVEAKLKEKNT